MVNKSNLIEQTYKRSLAELMSQNRKSIDSLTAVPLEAE